MNKKNQPIVIAVIIAIFLLLLYFFGGPRHYTHLDSGYRPVMGTFARVVAVAKDSNSAKKFIESALAEINKVDDLMSDYKDDSEVTLVNKNAFNQPVKVSQSTFEVLQKSIEFSRLSDGAFDITVGPLVDLWRRAAEANSVPSDDELSVASSKVGYEKLILDANILSVSFKVAAMRIDLGGIAKGYAIDKAVQAMQSAGATGGMVDIGGDIRCFGRPSGNKKSWLIGLQNPNIIKDDFVIPAKPVLSEVEGAGIQNDESLIILKLTDAAIATSGGYRRFALIDGKKFSHIINRQTGIAPEGLSSVTIITQNAIDADALATAVSVLGTEKGIALIEKIPQTEAILITSQNEIIKTPTAEKFIK